MELAGQRRAFVRVPVSRPATLSIPDPESGEAIVLRAHLVDVSERAVRCVVRVDDERATKYLARGRRLTITFSVTTEFVLAASVWRRVRKRHPDESEQIVVHFEHPVAGAKALRRELYAEQIRQHRLTVVR